MDLPISVDHTVHAITLVVQTVPIGLGRTEEPADSSCVLDWSEWAASSTHGVNTLAKTVLIHSLVRGQDGDWTAQIPPREFGNLIGRAGRAMQQTEGIALLFTEATQAAGARHSIQRFVKRINAD